MAFQDLTTDQIELILRSAQVNSDLTLDSCIVMKNENCATLSYSMKGEYDAVVVRYDIKYDDSLTIEVRLTEEINNTIHALYYGERKYETMPDII